MENPSPEQKTRAAINSALSYLDGLYEAPPWELMRELYAAIGIDALTPATPPSQPVHTAVTDSDTQNRKQLRELAEAGRLSEFIHIHNFGVNTTVLSILNELAAIEASPNEKLHKDLLAAGSNDAWFVPLDKSTSVTEARVSEAMVEAAAQAIIDTIPLLSTGKAATAMEMARAALSASLAVPVEAWRPGFHKAVRAAEPMLADMYGVSKSTDRVRKLVRDILEEAGCPLPSPPGEK